MHYLNAASTFPSLLPTLIMRNTLAYAGEDVERRSGFPSPADNFV